MTTPRDWSPLCTRAMSTSSNVGIIANSVVFAAWFTQRGSQPAAGVTSSAEGWSVVSAFKLAASNVSLRLDPNPRSIRMMSFTPVYIHAGRWDRSWRGARRFDRKSCNTIFPPLGAIEGRAADEKCKPVVDVRLHHRPVFSPPFL
jgi:hypothetical protein